MPSLNEEHIEYLLDSIQTAVLGGRPLDKAISALQNQPYGTPAPEGELKEAIRRFKIATGQIVTYEQMDAIEQRETESGEWYTGPDYENHQYWPTLRPILEKKLGGAIEEIDRTSSRVIASLRPSGEAEFSKRGLVLGHVQSGKTTNFVSVIAKAADIGYRLIIVLAGLTDNLRYQTQKRLEDQLLSQTDGWHKLTLLERDFMDNQENNAATLLGPQSNVRMIAVVKKNATVLKKLVKFIRSAQDKADRCPILIIDDEADQASINVSPAKKQEVSAINAQIRALLRNKKSAYVAYTATPFANILVDPNDDQDIYPRDFIHVLPEPKGYFGSESIFGREPLLGEEMQPDDGLDMIRHIPEDEEGLLRPPSKKDLIDSWSGEIPESLVTAVKWFILATAARRQRGQEFAHSSMLVHTAMKTVAHQVAANLLEQEVRKIKSSFYQGNLDEELNALWDKETARVPASDFGFAQVRYDIIARHIPRVLDDLEIVIDNGYSEERLEYPENQAKTVIAIGGNTLARGLTLEGLVCSYFVRNATAFDTLSQMGRWFGFRNGYQDLPRIWMTEELESWFRSLALLEADLRQDLARYSREGITPMDFQARLRVHKSMPVTSRAKQKAAVVSNPSFSGQRVQTILFRHLDADWLKRNFDAAKSLINKLRDGDRDIIHRDANGTFVFKDVSTDDVLEFLREYRFYEESDLAVDGAAKLINYIERERQLSSIRTWNVSVYGKARTSGESEASIDLGLGQPVNLINRSQMMNSKKGVANIKSLVGSMDRLNDANLDRDQLSSLRTEIDKSPRRREATLIETRDRYLGPDVGHLALYFINPQSKPLQQPEISKGQDRNRRKNLNAQGIVVGIGIFFPPTNKSEPEPEYISAPAPDQEMIDQYREAEEEIQAVGLFGDDIE